MILPFYILKLKKIIINDEDFLKLYNELYFAINI